MKMFTSFLQRSFNNKGQVQLLFTNVYVLYFLLLVSLFQLLHLASQSDFLLISVFLLVGFLATFFTKNMSVVIFLSVVFTQMTKYMTYFYIEGVEGFDGTVEEDETSTMDVSGSTNQADIQPAQKDTENFVKTMKADATELLDLQERLLANMDKLDPLLSKAGELVKKFDKYSDKKGNKDVMEKAKKAMATLRSATTTESS